MCRQMFVNHRLAKVAAEKELQEAQARIDMQQQLAAAQTQVQEFSSNHFTLGHSLCEDDAVGNLWLHFAVLSLM